MTSRVEIFNLALGHLGDSAMISSPDQAGKQAQECRRAYDQARRSELRSFPWAFASMAAALALETDTDKLGYGNVYRVPVDSLRIYGVMPQTGVRTWMSTPGSCWESPERAQLPVVPYTIMGTQILADLDGAYVTYARDVTEAEMTDPLFVDVLSLALAVRIAPAIIGTAAGQQASRLLIATLESTRQQAYAQALNEQGRDYRPESPSITARN